ncbi:ComEA family DNA-binding protein [Cupriavidus agavae]|uniref:Competence protein ComEA n=1 Tax=Cupriavidus agavae TaxID=1001822 RepID=A0A4Q7SAV5_9BURK|nr:helix-hairpin-helix domain-containing protein [Cupriavidus agavae]RZT42850.1 competence protein ComEA [Cupriavidus agavae]
MQKTFVSLLSEMADAARGGCRRVAVAFGAALAMLAMGPACAAIDINAADESALTSVKGIGPATAKRILDERTKHGAFKDAIDLADRVPGVGPKSAANLEAAGLTFGKAAAPTPARAAPQAAQTAPAPAAKAPAQKPAAR